MRTTRQQLLGGIAALGASLTIPSVYALGQDAKPVPRVAIDTHHHYLPPKVAVEKRAALEKVAPGFEAAFFTWTPQHSIEAMDKNGIATAIVSVSTPGVWFGDVAEGRRIARECNEYAAQMVRDYPGRFGFFAAIPLPDVEGSLREIEYAVSVLKADGVGLMSSYDGKSPGEAQFAPVFDDLNRRKTVVFIHPTLPVCCTNMITDVPAAAVEFGFDTTRAALSLLASGTFSRCPDLKFIFAQGGGTLPFLANRIEFLADRFPAIKAKLPHGAHYELQRLYFDTGNITNPGAFPSVRSLAAISQLLFATDYPQLQMEASIGELHNVGLSPAELLAIQRDNPLRLFPHLRSS